jgi:hypothetical protein
MRLILFFILVIQCTRVLAQKERINDSTYLIEDIETKNIRLSQHSTYYLRLIFRGEFANDKVEVLSDKKVLLADTLRPIAVETTERYFNTAYNLKIPVRKKRKLNLILRHNGSLIPIPFKYGYSLLYISVWLEERNGKNRLTYGFRFTNNPIKVF